MTRTGDAGIGNSTDTRASDQQVALSQSVQDLAEKTRTGPQQKPAEQLAGDSNPHGAREVYDAQGKFVNPGAKGRFEGEPPTGNDSVDRAYDYTGWVRDFYKEVFNRDSLDGKGTKIVSVVNLGDKHTASWDMFRMVYGTPGMFSAVKSFINPDVTAHEMTHAITRPEFYYHGQSGALCESFSDVMAVLARHYRLRQTANEGSWAVGEGIWRDGVNGHAMRDLLHPGTAYNSWWAGKDTQPADMAHYVKGEGDEGGVHYNSSIPSRAFALFATKTGGYAWEKPGHIWYGAMLDHLPYDCNFATFAGATIDTAKKLGFPDVVPKLQEAWKEVGVEPVEQRK